MKKILFLIIALSNSSLMTMGGGVAAWLFGGGDVTLSQAVEKNDYAAVSKLLSDPKNLEEIEKATIGGLTLLQFSSQKGNVPTVKLLLKFHADANAVGSLGQFPPLMFAITGGYKDIADDLLRAGADINYLTSDGKSALSQAISTGKVPLVEFVLAKVDPKILTHEASLLDQVGNVEKQSPLMLAQSLKASFEKDTSPVGKVRVQAFNQIIALLENAINKSQHSEQKSDSTQVALAEEEVIAETPTVDDLTNDPALKEFAAAVEANEISKVESLLKEGFDTNTRGANGRTPLIEAAILGNNQVVKLLISDKAHIDTADNKGWTALMEAANYGHNDVVMSLIKAGADVNYANNIGWTALMTAAYRGKLDILETLLQNKADVNQADKEGMTALMWAAFRGKTDAVNALIKAGADRVTNK